MIKSMTGFAKASSANETLNINIELRSYNNRYLDIVYYMPSAYKLFEDKIKTIIRSSISRGRVEIRLEIQDDFTDESAQYLLNETKAKSYINAIDKLRKKFKISEKISLDNILRNKELIVYDDSNKDIENHWPMINECLTNALTDFNLMREKEGNHILNDFDNRLEFIQNCINRIEKETTDLLPQYQKRLNKRITELTNGVIELDQSRITQEIAILADKSDITEEIVRIKSHIKQFKTVMGLKEASGKKLNFLLQELNREFNTIGSKVGNADISFLCVEVKSELEKLREQLLNIE